MGGYKRDVIGVRLVWLVLASCGVAAPATERPAPSPGSAGARDAAEPSAPSAPSARRAQPRRRTASWRTSKPTALAATCEPGAAREPRCLPSCYAAEPPDPRAGKKLAGAMELAHVACTRAGSAPFLADELGGARLAARPYRGRPPKPSKPGTWQAEVEAAVAAALQPERARGDVVRVTGGWKTIVHPASNERLRCVTVSHYTKAARGVLDACGARGAVACEAAGNAAAHGLNVVHYRLVEARRQLAAGARDACRTAALEAIAVARGMPRWRQYVALNIARWRTYARYRTRFDGLLDEDALFARVLELGAAAESVHAACGGAASPRTAVADEQSFHRCW